MYLSHPLLSLICFGLLFAFTGAMKLYATARGGDEAYGPGGKVRLSPAQQLVTMPVVLGLMLLPLIGGPYLDYRKLVAIHQHGQRVDAVVDAIHHRCGKHSCTRWVRYHYAPAGQSATMTGDEFLGRDDDADPHVASAGRTGHVPIAYDSTHPNRSALNFNDDVFTGAQEARALAGIRTAGGLITLMIGMITVTAMIMLAFSGRSEPSAGWRAMSRRPGSLS